MNKPDSNGELTSTLHLGLRSVVDGSPESALNALLSSASETDRLAITAVIEGPADRAMVVIHRGPSKGARFLIDSGEVAIGRSVAYRPGSCLHDLGDPESFPVGPA